ncbi:MAG: MBL fold metallo-hydrolase [Chitinophagales bacterium]
MKKLLLSILSLIILIAAIAWTVITFFPHKLVPMMLDQQMKRQTERIEEGEALLTNKEAITVYTVGTASPMPGERVQTGTAVFVNGHFFMFDVGNGVVQKAENMGLPLDKLDGIFITHWHSDHFIDLPSLISRSWLLGRTNDVHLYGPNGTDTLNHAVNQLLHIENKHRLDHHSDAIMDTSKAKAIAHEFKNVQGGKEVVYQQDGITITAFDVNHEPIEPAVGYAIEYKGKKVVISGDTKKNDLVLEMAKDADLLLHEVLLVSLLQQMEVKLKEMGNARNSKIIHDIQDYHTSPAEVAEIAAKAKVKKLVLHHFAPAPDLKVVENLYWRELKGFDGEIHFAKDGDRFVIP